QGVVGALAVRGQETRPELALELLRRGENYLRAAGAVEITAYGVSPNHPFYLGFYGGCEMPGVLASDLPTREAFAAAGYQECGRRSILQRPLADFRPPVDRALLQARRNYVVEQDRDLLPETWWDALGYVHADRRRFSLRLRN